MLYRYFFRLLLLSKEGAINLDEEDDEELTWETHDEKGQTLSPNIRKDSKDNAEIELLKEDDSRINVLEEENLRLKGQVKALAVRVTELEKELALRDSIPSPSPFDTVLKTKQTVTASNLAGDRSNSVPANSKALSKKSFSLNGGASEGATLDSPSKGSIMTKCSQLSLNTSFQPNQSSDNTGNNASSTMSSFKPITGSSSNTMNTIMGTRVSAISSSATTHATESSTNTGSVSPLTEVTEGFIRRGAQRITQPVNTLSNISSNVSGCTSEQEHNTFNNNNDLQSETASEDSGVLVPVDRAVSTSSLRTKDSSVDIEMEMSSLNLISSFDSVVKQTLAPSQHQILSAPQPLQTAPLSLSNFQPAPISVQSTVPTVATVAVAIAVERIASKTGESVKASTDLKELAALDGDEEDDDGWS